MKEINLKKLKLYSLTACYLFFLAGYIIALGFLFLSDKSKLENGELQPLNMQIEDFELLSIIPYNKGWEEFVAPIVSTDSDPQIILKKDFCINSLSYKIRTHILPGEAVVYYKEKGDADFNENKKIYPSYTNVQTGEYVYIFNTIDATEIRIDPVSSGACIFEITNIKINANKTLSSYFVPTAAQLLCIVFLPFVLWCVVCEILSLVLKRTNTNIE